MWERATPSFMWFGVCVCSFIVKTFVHMVHERLRFSRAFSRKLQPKKAQKHGKENEMVMEEESQQLKRCKREEKQIHNNLEVTFMIEILAHSHCAMRFVVCLLKQSRSEKIVKQYKHTAYSHINGLRKAWLAQEQDEREWARERKRRSRNFKWTRNPATYTLSACVWAKRKV